MNSGNNKKIILIIIFGILTLVNLIGVIIVANKKKTSNNKLKEYKDANPKDSYTNDQVYNNLNNQDNKFLFILAGVITSLIILCIITAILFYIL